MVQGVAELVQNYPVDGIHFDDYFTPRPTPPWTRRSFDQSGQGDRAFRRQQVTALVKAVHDASRRRTPPCGLASAPQGNPDNDLTQQYSDVYSWLAAEGEQAVLDHLCPQIYWGYGYVQRSGSIRFGFENIVQEWLAMPRSPQVALYFGLGAYRVGQATAAPIPTAWSNGAPAGRWHGRWPTCAPGRPAAGRCTAMGRCSAPRRRSWRRQNVRR